MKNGIVDVFSGRRPELPPATRRTDPDTSIEAELGHRQQRVTNASRLEAWVWLRPGHTSLEIARATGLDRHEVSRRLADLRSIGHATNGPKRKCSVNGHKMLTWFVYAKPAGSLP